VAEVQYTEANRNHGLCKEKSRMGVALD
jgi:hypothetical protein